MQVYIIVRSAPLLGRSRSWGIEMSTCSSDILVIKIILVLVLVIVTKISLTCSHCHVTTGQTTVYLR